MPTELGDKSLAELHELAAERDVPRFRALRREELIEALGGESAPRRDEPEPDEPEADEPEAHEEPEREDEEPEDEDDERDDQDEEREDEDRFASADTATGVLEIVPDGFGFIRVEGFGRADGDVFVTRSQIRALGLRAGDELSGPVRPKRRSERHASLGEVRTVNGREAEGLRERPRFADLTAAAPGERLAVAGGGPVTRMVELVAPLVKGGRVLVSGPPRAGATTLLRALLDDIARDGTVTPIVALVDARPEEAADWRRSAGYTVHFSPADASAEAHVELATLALERARRFVEQGDDVVLAIDSITRLARSFQGRQRGGDESGQRAKRWFAAGRNTEEGGSLTILATAHSGGPLYDALSDVATAELVLDADLAAAGHAPPLDVRHSFARAEGVLAADGDHLRRMHAAVQGLPAREAWQHVADQVR